MVTLLKLNKRAMDKGIDLDSCFQKAEFDMEFGPNYYATFEIRFNVNTEEVTVTVQDQTNEEVWEHDIDMAGKGFILQQHHFLS